MHIEKAPLAEQVRREFLHAWNGYKQFAWGSDELRPLSKTSRNWYATSLLLTPLDALDGLILLGFEEEATSTRMHIVDNLRFDQDLFVSVFEVNIRVMGSLLSAYQLTGDVRLLERAEDLGLRFLPAFNTPTGLPYAEVNLKTGAVQRTCSNPAEAGTLILELGTLSKLTGNSIFYDRAKTALEALYERRSAIDLVGEAIDVETGAWTNTVSHVGGCIDSYYEYLLKGALLFGDDDLRTMWETHIAALNAHVAREVDSGLWYGRVDMHSGKPLKPYFGALDAFFSGLLARSGDLERAARLQDSNDKMWNRYGLEPETFNFETMDVADEMATYHLRPEVMESACYLYHYTQDPRYLEMGKTFLEGLMRYCKTETGYAAIEDVRTMAQRDEMESFLLGETFKYLYLLFAEDTVLDLDEVIFTTEACPLRRTW